MTEPPKHVRSLSTSTVIYKPTAPSPKPVVGTSARRSVSASGRPKLNVSSPESKLAPRTINNGRSATPAFKEKGSFEFAQPTNRFPVKPTNTSPAPPSLKPPKPDRASKAAAAEKARSLLRVDWALLDSKMPTGKDSDSTKRRRILFKQFDMLGDGRITLASTHKTITSVLNMWNMFPPQVVQLAHQAAAAYTGDGPPPKFSKKVTVGEYVDWNKFRMLLVYLRQHLELWVMFDAVNVSRDGHLKEAEFVANFELLVQYGFDFPDPVKSFHEIKMSKSGGGVLFKDFAHWGLTKRLHMENSRGDVSEPTSPTHKTAEEHKFVLPLEEKKLPDQPRDEKKASGSERVEEKRPEKSPQSPETAPRALETRAAENGKVPRSSETATTSRLSENGNASRPPESAPRLSDGSRMSETSKLLLANSPPLIASPRLSNTTPSSSPIPEIRVTPPAVVPMTKPQAPPKPPALPPRGKITPAPEPQPPPKPPANADPDYVEEGEAEGDEEEEEDDDEEDDDAAEEAEVAQDQRNARKAVEEELASVRSTEAERLAEYALLEFEVVRAPETKAVRGVVRDFVARELGRGCLCFTDALDYMENCMYEAEEAELEEEERARQAELESSEEDDDDCDPFFPSWLENGEEYNSDNDGQFMEQVQEAECEVCEDKHPANVRCIECEENMCEKLGLAHKKSKIGKDHTMGSPKYEPPPIEPQRKTSAEENLERAAAEKISAFKSMMDAKVKMLRLGKATVLGEQRLRVGVRTWGKATLLKCELCEEQHAAGFLCVDCGQNMCDKLAAVHAKSKIGRDHELKPL